MANREVTVALDLGSEATVAYARIGQRDPFAVPLQRFAPALTETPAILRGDDGRPSHRIRSRYAARPRVLLDPAPAFRPDPAGFDAVLPAGHALVRQFDVSEFARYATYQPVYEPRDRSFFRFFDDAQTPVDLDEILPSAKLVFQRGAREERAYAFRNADGAQGRFEIGPAELVVEQTASLLENFVRALPEFRDRGWEAFDVVLTVPNTYSPMHRRTLANGVRERLPGVEVKAISESDAIVHAYWDRTLPNRNRKEAAIHRIATFDVGKGTVDLSLVDIRWGADPKDPDSEVLVKRRLAQAGGAWGGARVSFAIARLLEALLARAHHRLSGEALPFGFTFASDGFDPKNLEHKTALAAFESVVEAHKRLLSDVKAFADLGTRDPETAKVARRLLRFVRGRERSYDPDALAEFEAALLAPGTQRHLAENGEDFSRFEFEIDGIVRKNLDYIGDLATALLGSLGRSEPVRDPKRAIEFLGEAATEEEMARTVVHFVVSGQGSLFAPLRRELDRTLSGAGMPAAVVVGARTGGTPEPKPKLLDSLKSRLRLTEEIDPARSARISAVFDGPDRKDACARGALVWRGDGISHDENPNAELGQLVISRDGEPELVPMDELDRVGYWETPFGVATEGGSVRRVKTDVYYLPSRGSRFEPGGSAPIREIGQRGSVLRIEKSDAPGEIGISFRILLDGEELPLNPDRGGGSLEEAGQEELRALLWPSRLTEDDARAAWVVGRDELEEEEDDA